MAGGPVPLIPAYAQNVDESVSISRYQQVLPQSTKTDFGVLPTSTADILAAKAAASNQLDQAINAATTTTVYKTPEGTTNIFKNINTPYTTQSQINQEALKNIKTRPNILDQYANYTYHIVFSMIEESQAYSVTSTTNLANLNRIIIAESGATTGFNISKFGIHNTVSPGFKNHNQNLMEWDMTITEPFGLTFPDYLIVAAEQLQIKNSARFPFFIELWFTGYDEDGKIVAPNISRRIWRVIMLDFDLQNSQVGTTYNLTGIMDNDIGSANQFAMTSTTINLDKINSFDDALSQLNTALNSAAKGAEASSSSTVYDIQAPRTINLSSWKIQDPDPKTNDPHSDSTTGQGKTLTLNRGQDIGNFITGLMGKCGNESEAFLRGTSGSANSPSLEKHGLGNIMQLFTEVKYGDFNPITNDYNKTITYKLIPYSTTRTACKDREMATQLSSITVQRNKLQYLVDNNLLAKKYEYIYTGKNTDIIKFDIRVDNFWAISLPTYFGGRTFGQVTQGLIVNAQSQYVRETLNQSVQYKTDVITTAKASAPDAALSGLSPSAFAKAVQSQTGLSSTISQAAGQLASAQSKITNLTNMASTIQKLASGVAGLTGTGLNINNITGILGTANQVLGSLTTLAGGPLALFNTGTQSTIQSITNGVQSIAATATDKVGGSSSIVGQASASTVQAANRKTRYLEDMKSAIESTDPQKIAFMFDPEPQAQNVVNMGAERKNTISDADTAKGAMPTGQSLFAQTVKNVYSNSFMLEVELEIRGDPWWIGMTNLEQNEYSQGLTQSVAKSAGFSFTGLTASNPTAADGKANFLVGENMFLLNFRNGTNYNEETGLMNLDMNNDYFNGIYAVLEVTNRFENGSFTQTLSAFKELFSQGVNKELKSSIPPSSGTSTGWMDGNKTPNISQTTYDNPNITSDGKDFSQLSN